MSTSRTESACFAAVARTMVRQRTRVLLGSLLISAGLVAFSWGRLKLDNSLDAYVDPRSEVARTNEQLRDTFGNDVVHKVVVAGDVFTLPYVRRLRALQRALETMDVRLPSLGTRPGRRRQAPALAAAQDDFFEEGDFGDDQGWGDEAGGSLFQEITSILNARRTQSVDGALRVAGWLEGVDSDAAVRALAAPMLAERTLRGRLLGPAGQHSVIELRTDFMSGEDALRFHGALKRLLRAHAAPGFEPMVSGFHALATEQISIALRDMTWLVGLSLLVALLTMGLVFRHPLGVLGPVFAVLEAIVSVLAAFAVTDTALSSLTTIVPVFIMAVGIGDAVHIQSVYRQLRRQGVDNDLAIERAVAATGVPVLFTTLTTAAGLFSFHWASSPVVRELGVFAGVGVIAAMLGCFTVVPAVLTFNRRSLLGARPAAASSGALDRFLAWCNAASAGRRTPWVLAVTLLLGAGSVGAATRLHATNDPLKDVPPTEHVRRATEMLDQHVGGAANLALLIEPAEGRPLTSREVLVALEDLERAILAYRHARPPHTGERIVENVSSVLDVIRESWRALHDNDPRYEQLPPTQRGVDDMLTMFSNESPARLKQLMTIDRSATLMVARVRWLDSAGYEPLAAHIRAAIARTVGDKARVRLAGSVFGLISSGSTITTDMLTSFAIAFVVIAVFMVILLRELKLGLIAMVPNLLPIAVVLGGLALLGFPLDFSNVMIASIAIGIAVDDTIHFLHQFGAHHRAHGDREAAITHAYVHSGRAMVITSAILVLGFSVYGAALAYTIIRFGAVLAATVICALMIDLLCTPALLRGCYRPRSPRGDAQPITREALPAEAPRPLTGGSS